MFSATEAAGMGAAGALLITFLKEILTGGVLLEVAREAALLTAKLFALLFGASMFSNFLNRAGFPDALLDIINYFELSGLSVILLILLIYILLGCVFESMSMILLTVPIFAPLVHTLGFDLIWFGILVVVVTEISLITPPIGLNVFVLKGVIKDVPVSTIFKGVTFLDSGYHKAGTNSFYSISCTIFAFHDVLGLILRKNHLSINIFIKQVTKILRSASITCLRTESSKP